LDYPNFGKRDISFRAPAVPTFLAKKWNVRPVIKPSKLLESDLAKAGFQPDALIRQSEVEARQRTANLIAEAESHSAAVLKDLRGTVTNFMNRVEHLKALAVPDAPAQYFLLDTASEISTHEIAPPIHQHAGPSPECNWAKFAFNASHGDDGPTFGSTLDFAGVSFGFLWQNPSDNYAVVNVDGYIVMNGFATVGTDGGYVTLFDYSRLTVDASLDIEELWNEPFTSPIRQPAQSQTALNLEVSDSGIVSPGGFDGQNLYRGFDLQYSQFVMPPKGLAMFFVSCGIATQISNGEAHAYFDSPSQQVLSPGVLITVLP
jgi:hypothetical protein